MLLGFASGLFAAGEYQQTKGGRTTVWNNDPKPGDEAAWSGDRDRQGYATGFGTLTWYSGPKRTVKQLGILSVTKANIYARYYGNMVRGKFSGPVNVHVKGKTNNAIFIDGVRTTVWESGRTPSWATPSEFVDEAKPEAEEPAAPAEGPDSKADGRIKKEEVRLQTSETASSKSRPTASVGKSKDDVDESLRTLVGPPSVLHAKLDTAVSSVVEKKEEPRDSTEPRLTKEQVADRADAEARTRGYNPAEYGRTDPDYNQADKIWSVNYERQQPDESESAQRFSVTVDDKTNGIVFVLGKNKPEEVGQ